MPINFIDLDGAEPAEPNTKTKNNIDNQTQASIDNPILIDGAYDTGYITETVYITATDVTNATSNEFDAKSFSAGYTAPNGSGIGEKAMSEIESILKLQFVSKVIQESPFGGAMETINSVASGLQLLTNPIMYNATGNFSFSKSYNVFDLNTLEFGTVRHNFSGNENLGMVFDGMAPALALADVAPAVNNLTNAYTASRFLRSNISDRQYIKEVLHSFNWDDLSVSTSQHGMRTRRVWDGLDAEEAGRYHTSTTQTINRESLAINPNWNRMTHLTEFRIPEGNRYLSGRAAPQGPNLPGGGIQFFFPNRNVPEKIKQIY
jgi:hypothetical protein